MLCNDEAIMSAASASNAQCACRLLRASVAEAERVIGAPLPAISHFAEEQSAELRDRIFDEFNSLAVLLRAPAATFVQAAQPGSRGRRRRRMTGMPLPGW